MKNARDLIRVDRGHSLRTEGGNSIFPAGRLLLLLNRRYIDHHTTFTSGTQALQHNIVHWVPSCQERRTNPCRAGLVNGSRRA